MVVLSANRMAIPHFLGSMPFAKKSINPNTVKLNPRIFNAKGKASRADNVLTRFFQLISENAKIGFSFSPAFLRLEMIKSDREKTPSKKAERKGTIPEPGFLKLPRPTLNDETSKTAATSNKKRLLM